MKKSIFLMFGVLFLSAAVAADGASVTRIIDGDTIVVFTGAEEIIVRLIGVDTPESKNNAKAKKDAELWGVTVEEVVFAGKEASLFTASICPPGITVTIPDADRKRDRYGRLLAYAILPDGQCLNEILIRMGYGLAYRQEKFAKKAAYVEAEQYARQQRLNFWATVWRNAK